MDGTRDCHILLLTTHGVVQYGDYSVYRVFHVQLKPGVWNKGRKDELCKKKSNCNIRIHILQFDLKKNSLSPLCSLTVVIIVNNALVLFSSQPHFF